MPTIRQFLCAFVITLLLPAIAFASELSVSSWQTTGSQSWHISFPVNGASKLYYPQNTKYFLVNYSQPINTNKSLSVEYGSNQTSLGTGSDSDWDYTKSNALWYYGEFNSKGHSYFANLNFNAINNQYSKFYYGYGYHHSNFLMTNGMYTVENYNAVSDPLPDLNSSYTITYQGPQIGLQTEHPFNNRLSLLSTVIYAPFAVVKAHGWWNLRNLDFVQTGSGQMLDGTIGLRYMLSSKHSETVFLGYRYQQLKLNTGTENTSATIDWDKAVHVQKGLYFGASTKL